jgi:hypothetical protein
MAVRIMAVCSLTPTRASAEAYARRIEWKSTGSVVAVSAWSSWRSMPALRSSRRSLIAYDCFEAAFRSPARS